jgi:hypothetical protein
MSTTYAIQNVQANLEGLKLNGIHQLPIYANYINLLGENIHTTKKNTESLLVASKEVGLGINAEKLSICPCFINRIQEENTT